MTDMTTRELAIDAYRAILEAKRWEREYNDFINLFNDDENRFPPETVGGRVPAAPEKDFPDIIFEDCVLQEPVHGVHGRD